MATNSQTTKVIKIVVEGNQATASINDVTVSTKKLNQEIKQLSINAGKGKAKGSATGGATATVLELGRTISDSNYGIRGMANNLSQLVSNLVFTTRAAGGLTAGLKSIWSALMGPLGLILVFQGFIALLERFSMTSKKAEEELQDFNKALKDEIRLLDLYATVLTSTNASLEQRLAVLKGISHLDKDLANKLKEANGDRQKENEILQDHLKGKKAELVFKEKEKAFLEDTIALEKASNIVQEDRNLAGEKYNTILYGNSNTSKKFTENMVNESAAQTKLTKSRKEYLEALLDINNKEENKTIPTLKRLRFYKQQLLDLDKQKLDFEKREKLASTTLEDEKFEIQEDFARKSLDLQYDTFIEKQNQRHDQKEKEIKQMEIDESQKNILLEDLTKKHNETLFLAGVEYFEAAIAQEGMFAALRKEKRIKDENEEIERSFERSNYILQQRQTAIDAELAMEMRAVNEKNRIRQLEVDFMRTIGGMMNSLAGESEGLAKASLIVTKGAAIAQIVVQTQKSIATDIADTNAAMAQNNLAFGGGVLGTALATSANKILYGDHLKRVSTTKTRAGLSIAAIIASTIGKLSSGGLSGGGASGGGAGDGGGRTFDFNLVGSTGTNQLTEAVGGQFQEPIQAYVVSNEITSQQELDLQIQTGASLGD